MAPTASTASASEPAARTAVIAPLATACPVRQPRPSATLPQAVLSLDAVYRQLARPWPDDELAERYHAAYERGAGDLPAGEEPPERPITLLATAIPRLISLAVAANVLHLLPTSTRDALDVAERADRDDRHHRHRQPAPLPPRPPIRRSNPAATTPMSGCRSPTSRPPTGSSTPRRQPIRRR